MVKYKDIVKGMKNIAARDHTISLDEAQQRVQAHLAEGIICPCCNQYCKLYRRKLNSGMAHSLIWLVKRFEKTGRWVEVQREAPRSVLASREIGKLAHWELVELMPEHEQAKKTSGMWRPTEKGIDFVYRRRSVPSHVYLYDNQVYRFDKTAIYIDDALGDHFDYNELMSVGRHA